MDQRHADLLHALKVVCTDSSVAGSESLQIFGLRSAERLLFVSEWVQKKIG